MIAASLGSMILAGVLSTFLMLVRSGVRVGNYSVMETETRRAFEQLGIDSRMANNFSFQFHGQCHHLLHADDPQRGPHRPAHGHLRFRHQRQH